MVCVQESLEGERDKALRPLNTLVLRMTEEPYEHPGIVAQHTAHSMGGNTPQTTHTPAYDPIMFREKGSIAKHGLASLRYAGQATRGCTPLKDGLVLHDE
jgi:hypothetical protein